MDDSTVVRQTLSATIASDVKEAENSVIRGRAMTGMGADGAQGLLEMKQAGAHTIAQDEKSCVVFGMLHEAIKLNAHMQIVSLEHIASVVLKHCR